MSIFINQYQSLTYLGAKFARDGDISQFIPLANQSFDIDAVIGYAKEGHALQFLNSYKVHHPEEDLEKLTVLASDIDHGHSEARQLALSKNTIDIENFDFLISFFNFKETFQPQT